MEQREPRNITALCSLLGYSRQGFYQGQQQMQKEVFEQEILLQEVLAIRTKQKRLGGRRLLTLTPH